jgi:hypothetical protein
MRPSAAIAACALVACSSRPVLAQTPAAPAERSGQPIVVERVYSRWVIGPEYKLTSVDGESGHLAGLSGGRLIQELFYIGGAMYWLAGGASTWDMHYGGLVVGVQMPPGRRVAFGVKGLLGAGGATSSLTLEELFGGRLNLPMGRLGRFERWSPFVPGDQRVELSDTFLVFEPEATVAWKVTRRIRFGVSAGYRFTGNADAYAFDDRLNGATGAVVVQFGLGES